MLAERLNMTVKELLGKTDSRELSEWMVYFNLEHWRKKFMSDKQRSDEIKQTLFGKRPG